MIGKIQQLKNKKGFTLVELIVVIAIIAVLTAVIVPLIARYTAQAQYTTLQDAAQTISNTANSALSDANQIGVVSTKYIAGKKSGSTFYVSVGGTTVSSAVTNYSDDPKTRCAEKLYESLVSTLPDKCSFYISVKASAVEGVIYNLVYETVSGGDKCASDITSISKVDGFDTAYGTASSGGQALGVSGIYLTQTTPSLETVTYATKTA